MFTLGWQETVFIFVLALLIFGPKKLPELGKTIGKALTEFRRASSELKSTFDREMAAIERESDSLKEVTSSYQSDLGSSYDHGYDSSYYDGEYQAHDSSDSTAQDTSTVGASADQGADSSSGSAPEGAPDSGAPAGTEAARPAPATDFQI
jgi:TatA/E family protein of Tat protein translocase